MQPARGSSQRCRSSVGAFPPKCLGRLLHSVRGRTRSDDFNKFKDADGQFRSSLGSNVKGLLSLYDAAYVGTHADAVLEEAITFCKHQLQHKMDHLESHLAVEVARALETPLIRRMRRLEASKFITFYEALNEAQNDLILELAKLDFSVLQSLHQDEIRNLSVWWKELGLIQSLNFARDRMVECYFWILGVYYEPCFSHARRMMTKVIALLSVLDDIYDSYGTLEELELLTNAIQRWDINSVGNLPQYIKVYLVALMDTYKEFEDELVGEGRSYHVHYLKEELKMVSLAYFEEAKWRNEGYIPTLEEHLRVSLISCGYNILTCASFLGMGHLATKETFDWLKHFPKIVKASTIICRLMSDIVAYEFEEKRHHIASTVQSYVKEYGVSNEKACQRLKDMINDAWKVMNEECLRPTIIPLQLLMSSFNLSRVMETYYKYSDGYTESSSATKDLISLLLMECI
uniref:(-)-germacrene D synthase n=1 Tax=Anthurium amnicola TaxID=1678845 RepID=A0A1D1ZD67_9ARAE